MSRTALSRRERQIMDIIYQRGQASAAEVLEALPDPPTYSSVRALLRILEEKGHLRHAEEGKKYIYLPTQLRQSAARSALQQVLQTFFSGSVENVVAALLSDDDRNITREELERLSALIERAKEEEK